MANDIVFLLRFDTEEGQRQVQQFATKAGTAIAKALNVQIPTGQGLSRALGLKEALADITTAQAKLSGLGATLSKLNLSQLDDLREKLIRRGSIPPRSSKGEATEDILIIDEARKTVRRREALQEFISPFTGTAEANRQASLESRKSSNPFIQQAAAARTQANREKGAELQAAIEAEQIANAIEVARNAHLRQVVPTAAERTQANKSKGIEALISSEVEAADAARLERRKPKLREQELKQIEKKIELTRQDLDRNALVSREERTLEKRRLDGLRKNVQNLREQNTRGVDGDIISRRADVLQERLARVRQRTRLAGAPGSSSSGNALGISESATKLLAVSSIVGQLFPRLGQITMSAGFAAFSLGGVAAGLSLTAAAASGYIELLKKSVETTKKAGLVTQQYSRAQIGLQLEIDGFLKVLGIKTQLAFAPVFDDVAELTKELGKLPWDEMISASAEAARGLLEVVDMLHEISGIKELSRINREIQDRLGLEGKQRVDTGKLIGSALTGPIRFGRNLGQEIREAFGPPGQDQTRFVHTPSFSFKPVEDVGKSMQEALLKNESKDPLVRAADLQNALLRNIYKELQGISTMPIGEILDRINPGIVVRD